MIATRTKAHSAKDVWQLRFLPASIRQIAAQNILNTVESVFINDFWQVVFDSEKFPKQATALKHLSNGCSIPAKPIFESSDSAIVQLACHLIKRFPVQN